ncbi:MAG: LicD family protein, partial [Coxiellaceae bacterium]|nr:LicD family protein [Coxiellaceae bacterium]
MEGETPLRQAQLVMLRMLKIFDHICKKHKLTYWLEAGTLLGAVRHHGFIPWDDDLDVSMLRKDYERFIRLAPDELPSDIFMQTEKSDPGYFNPAVPLKLRDKNSLLIEPHEVEDKHIHQGIFIDIFPYDTVPEKVSDYIKDKKRTKRLLKIKRAKLLPRRRAGSSYFKYKLISLGYSL